MPSYKPVNLAAKAKAEEEERARAQSQADDDVELYASSDSLEKLLAESGITENDATVHVYLIEPEAEPKVWSGAPEDYDLQRIAKQQGSGTYRTKIYARRAADGRYGVIANKIITVRLTAQEDAYLRDLRNGTLKGDSPAFTPETLAAAVKAAIPAPQQSPLELMRQTAEIMRSLMPAPVVAPSAPAVNPLELMKSFAEIYRSVQPREPIESGVNANGADIFLRLIDKFAPMFAEQLNKTAPVALPAPLGQSALQPQPSAAPQQENDMTLRLKMGLSFLCMQAEANNDPATYADVVLDNVPPAEVEEMLKKDNWIDLLAAFNPDVKKHAQWFNQLREAVKFALEEMKDEAESVDEGDKPAS